MKRLHLERLLFGCVCIFAFFGAKADASFLQYAPLLGVGDDPTPKAVLLDSGKTLKLVYDSTNYGAENPSISTSKTKPGLLYTFRAGTALEGFGAKAPSETKIGDGEAWTPRIKVKGGTSGFYMIGVEK